MLQPDDTAVIVVADVLVVRRSDFGWFCEVAGERVFFANLQIAPGFLMPGPGERGPIKVLAGTACGP
jgi:hypothetical protein